MNYLLILIGSIFVNNYVMQQFLGICPFLGVSKKVETAFGMGLAVTAVMTIASFVTYILQQYVLVPLDMAYMQTIVFILVIAGLVQFVEMFLKKVSFSLYQALGVYLPLITTNCAVLGVCVLNFRSSSLYSFAPLGFNLLEAVVNGFGSGIGFTLSIVLFAAIRERLAISNLPKWMDGFPGALISAGLMAVSFMGFAGLIK